MSKISNGVSVPSEVSSKGGVNEGAAVEARNGVQVVEIVDGPVVSDSGAYCPAAYVVAPGIVRIDR
jgi:hypothetical protein